MRSFLAKTDWISLLYPQRHQSKYFNSNIIQSTDTDIDFNLLNILKDKKGNSLKLDYELRLKTCA